MTASNRAFGFMMLLTTAVTIAFAAGVRAQLPAVVLVLLATGVVVGIAVACMSWWRTTDEAVREAHKFSWFFGSSAGLTLLVPMLVIISLRPDMVTPFVPEGYPLVAFGVLMTLALQMVGYVATWAGWWLKRR